MRDYHCYLFTDSYPNFSTLLHTAACPLFLAPFISRSKLSHAGLVSEGFPFGLLGHFVLQHHLLCMALHPSNYRASSRLVHGEGTGGAC